MTIKLNFLFLATLIGVLVNSFVACQPPPPPPTPPPATPTPATPPPATPLAATPAATTPTTPGTCGLHPKCTSTITPVEVPKLTIFFNFDTKCDHKNLAFVATVHTQICGIVPPEVLALQYTAVSVVEKISDTEILCATGMGDCAIEKAMACHQKLVPEKVLESATCLLSGVSPDLCVKQLQLDQAAYTGCIDNDAIALLIANNDARLKAKIPALISPAILFGDAPTFDVCISELFMHDFFGTLCSSFSGAKPDTICSSASATLTATPPATPPPATPPATPPPTSGPPPPPPPP